MPIGKNSIKRVANGGYSAVETHAPDMEHSTPVPAPAAAPAPETAPTVKPRAKVGRPRKSDVKSTEKKPAAPKKKAAAAPAKKKTAAQKSEKKAKTPAKTDEGFQRFEIGTPLPIHLL